MKKHKKRKKKTRYLKRLIVLTIMVVTVGLMLKVFAGYSDPVGDIMVLNDNEPNFTAEEIARAAESFEEYPGLDILGRCRACTASVGRDLMPEEERESIGMVKPSGWHTVRYDDLIEDKYLYNRCHLIGFQLTGENANKRNLITGTRYLNVEEMLPYENLVAEYVRRTGNHVLYRVTPEFEGVELVARGVWMEALSIEDNGAGIKFSVWCPNIQPGISIDYLTGLSKRTDDDSFIPDQESLGKDIADLIKKWWSGI